MCELNLSRRAFLKGRSPKFNTTAIRPPWSLPIAEFIEKCERCDECIKACPENILFRGEGGFPEINFKQGECTFCTECVNSCYTNAFFSGILKEEGAWDLSVTVESNCLSLNAIVCRICGDNCDENAINFTLQLGGISIPKITQESCTGCGACLFVCPNHSIIIKN